MVNEAEVLSIKPLDEVPEEERVTTLAASGDYPYILILDRGDEGDGSAHLTLDISNDYLDDDGRDRLKQILTAIADNL